MEKEGRAYSDREEARIFLRQLVKIRDHWAEEKGVSEKHRFDGVVFSILVFLDGGSSSSEMPSYDLCINSIGRLSQQLTSDGERRWHQNGLPLPLGILHELWCDDEFMAESGDAASD